MPITIGELTNVPSPGSPIQSPWAQAISSRVVQRCTNANRPSTPATGTMVFNTDKSRLEVWNGTVWMGGWSISNAGRTYFDATLTTGPASSGSYSAFTWGTEITDSDGFGAGTVTVTIPANTGGLYVITVKAAFSATGGTQAVMRISTTGSDAGSYDCPWATTQLGSITAVHAFNAADTFTAGVIQNSGATITVNNGRIRLYRLTG